MDGIVTQTKTLRIDRESAKGKRDDFDQIIDTHLIEAERWAIHFRCPSSSQFNIPTQTHNQIHAKARAKLLGRFQFASKHHRRSVSHH